MEEFWRACFTTWGYSLLIGVAWMAGYHARPMGTSLASAMGVAAIWGGGAGVLLRLERVPFWEPVLGQAVACAVIAYYGFRNQPKPTPPAARPRE